MQSNFGSLEESDDLGGALWTEIEQTLRESRGGKRGAACEASFSTPDMGSIMIVIGTDLPLSARQLGRVIRRAEVGLVRTGSFLGTGSGDVVIGFSNGNYLGEAPDGMEHGSGQRLPSGRSDFSRRSGSRGIHTGGGVAVEEAIYNSLCYAHPAVKRDGTPVHALPEFLADRGGMMKTMK